jgi:hypothetical protein
LNIGEIQSISDAFEEKYWRYNENEEKIYPYPIKFISETTKNQIKYKMYIKEDMSGPVFIIEDLTNKEKTKSKDPEKCISKNENLKDFTFEKVIFITKIVIWF